MSQSWSILDWVPEADVLALDSRCCIFLLIRIWKCEILMSDKVLSCFAIRFQRLQKQQRPHQKTQRGTAQRTVRLWEIEDKLKGCVISWQAQGRRRSLTLRRFALDFDCNDFICPRLDRYFMILLA